MRDQPSAAGSDNPVVCNHNWLFGTLIGWQQCQGDVLKLTFSEEHLSFINPDETTLLSTDLRSHELRIQVADTVIQVPRLNTRDKLTVRFLLEHKSRIDEHELMLQLLRYQVGLYERQNSPVVTVLINNGQPAGKNGVLQFRNWLTDSNDEFWRVYGDSVMNFNVVILNLRDPQVQKRLLKSNYPSALGWYAMGKASRHIDRKTAHNLVKLCSKFDDKTLDKVLVPVLGYLHHYHNEVTINKLKELGMQYLQEGKVMVEALEGWDIPKQLGRQEGLQEGLQKGLRKGLRKGLQEGLQEGLQKGLIESRQEIAERMLRDGIDQDFICKYTQMSAEEIEDLENGNKNSN